MKVDLINISKRYLAGYIFRDISYSFVPGKIYGISGHNGSGKTTLMKIISGYLTPSSGEVQYKVGESISRDAIYKHLSYSAPYMEIEENFTLNEQLSYYQNFKSFDDTFDQDKVLSEVDLLNHADKEIKNFSSGMKQKLQLILAMYSDVQLVLLDEPTSFLDAKSKQWFYSCLNQWVGNKTFIIASNDAEDLSYCPEVLDLSAVTNL